MFQPQAKNDLSEVFFFLIMRDSNLKKEYLISLEDIWNIDKQMEKIKVTPSSTTRRQPPQIPEGKGLDWFHFCNARTQAHSKCSVNIAKLSDNLSLNLFCSFYTNGNIY